MSIEPKDRAAWAHTHKACFEVDPLVEVHKGQQVTVGYELSLFAQVPMQLPIPERRAQSEQIYQTMRELLESLVPPDHATARLQIEPYTESAKLRPQTGYAPEVELAALVERKSESFAPLSTDTRQNLNFLEEGLVALGFGRGTPGSR
jgi:hypothetical protein